MIDFLSSVRVVDLILVVVGLEVLGIGLYWHMTKRGIAPAHLLPNLLAGEALVPEFFQEAVTSHALAQSLAGLLQDVPRREAMRRRFAALHGELRQDSARKAAEVVLELAGDAA
mgnify:CR=1 FL=1